MVALSVSEDLGERGEEKTIAQLVVSLQPSIRVKHFMTFK